LHFYTQKVFETSVYLLLLAISEEEKKAADAHLEEEFRLHAYVEERYYQQKSAILEETAAELQPEACVHNDYRRGEEKESVKNNKRETVYIL
jgi:hypothetical protein